MTNITDPSQSQGLLHPSARHTYPDNEGLQSIHQDVYDAPQVWDPASEGLQSVDYDGRNGPQVVEQSPLSPDLRYAHSGHADYEKSKILVSDQPISSTSRRGRRRLIWAIMVAVVIAIAIAVGVGAGVGLTRQSSDDSPENEQENGSEDVLSSTDSANDTTSPSGTTSSTASSTASSIAESGVVNLSCSNSSAVNSSYSVSYTQECGVYYQTNQYMIAPDPKSWVRNLPIDAARDQSRPPARKKFFLDCIDYCDEYNKNRNLGELGCYGVSYYANTTWADNRWGGNCFIKSGQGVGRSDGDGSENWDLTASAYMTCLHSEGENTCDV